MTLGARGIFEVRAKLFGIQETRQDDSAYVFAAALNVRVSSLYFYSMHRKRGAKDEYTATKLVGGMLDNQDDYVKHVTALRNLRGHARVVRQDLAHTANVERHRDVESNGGESEGSGESRRDGDTESESESEGDNMVIDDSVDEEEDDSERE